MQGNQVSMKVERQYHALLLLAGMIWGTSFVAGKIGVEGMDPFLFSGLRYVFTALSLLPIFLIYKFDYSLFKNKALWGISLLNALGMIFQNVGLSITTATNTVLLVDINVVIVAILAAFMLKESLNRRTVAGLVLGMGGVFLIATNGDLDRLGGGTFLGNVLVFTAGVLWAFYIVLTTRELKRGVPLLFMTCTILMETALLSFPICLVGTADFNLDMPAMMAAAYTGIICTTAAFLLYNVGLRALGATTTSIILLVEMVFGIFFSMLLLGETQDAITLIGGLMIITAILIISAKQIVWSRRRRLAQE